MKPPGFVYRRPDTVAEAVEYVSSAAPNGSVLAGGQSLVPLLNMRLAAPAEIIDINRIGDLGRIRTGPDGVRVGAVVRQAELEQDESVFAIVPLLRQALRHVAHPAIRNRGTPVGSLVHADPAGELPAVLALLRGTVTVRGPAGSREIPADDFFLGPLESAVRPDELATEAFFPALPDRSGTAWVEVSRRNGDYAICGVGALVTLDDDRRVSAGKVGLVSIGPTPVVVDLTAALSSWPGRDALQAARRHVAAHIRPENDIHATADYRAHLAEVLTERALDEAIGCAAETVR